MSNLSPLVSIIVPCRNERDHIAASLLSILGQDSPPGGFEVIVADGMSNDGTQEILRQIADRDRRLRVIDNPAQSVASGLNAAIAVANGEVIIRMDAHTQYAEDYVRSCLDVLQSTGAQNVGGPWIARGTGLVGAAIAAAFQSPFAVGTNRGHDPTYEGLVDTVYLGCWRKEMFLRIGLFDEELIRNQDDEFNLRLTIAGGRIWQSPRIRSWYYTRNSLVALGRQYRQYGYWKVRVVQKYGRPASLRHLVPGLFVFALAVLTLASPWWALAAKAWATLTAAYGAFVLTASLITARGGRWKLLPVLPLVFACYHLSYGYGSIRGLLDFVVLRRRASVDYTRLTRLPDPLRNRTGE